MTKHDKIDKIFMSNGYERMTLAPMVIQYVPASPDNGGYVVRIGTKVAPGGSRGLSHPFVDTKGHDVETACAAAMDSSYVRREQAEVARLLAKAFPGAQLEPPFTFADTIDGLKESLVSKRLGVKKKLEKISQILDCFYVVS